MSKLRTLVNQDTTTLLLSVFLQQKLNDSITYYTEMSDVKQYIIQFIL